MGIFVLISFLIEVGVLFYLEKKTWNTLYTPLNFLMLPYTVVLLISVAVAGHWGIVGFCYQSVLYWSVGLFLFAIPSFLLGFSLHKHGKPVITPIKEYYDLEIWTILAVFICVAFLYRLKQTFGSSIAAIGSDEFGENFYSHGFWAHLNKFYTPLLVIGIYYVDRKKWWIIILVVLMLMFSFIHQVKGWIIIPCIAGLSLRLYSGKTRMSMNFVFWLLIGAISVFLISYLLSFVLGNNSAMGMYMIEFILRHFVHYFTSGVLGFSMDVANGMPDSGETQILFSPFVNIINQISGEQLISPINSLYYHTGLNFTNVRTMFGTIAIYCNPTKFIIVTLFLSFTIYLIRVLAVKFNNLYMNVIYFYQCSLLSMGWFEYYFFHLDAIEVPLMTLLIWGVVYILIDKKVINHEYTL